MKKCKWRWSEQIFFLLSQTVNSLDLLFGCFTFESRMYFVAHFGEVEKSKTFRCAAEQLDCRRNKIEKKICWFTSSGELMKRSFEQKPESLCKHEFYLFFFYLDDEKSVSGHNLIHTKDFLSDSNRFYFTLFCHDQKNYG